MSVTGSIAVLGVLLLRFPLKRAPRWIVCALWTVVFLRLALPFSFSAPVSLLGGVGAPAPENGVVTYVAKDGVPALIDVTETVSVQNTLSAEQLSTESADSLEPTPQASADPPQIWFAIGTAVWLTGAAGILLYAVISYARLRRKAADAVLAEPGVFETDAVASPFVLGIVRPRILLPVDLTGEPRALVLRHERAHIRRLDHLAKPAAFLLLAMHWFNPLIWLAFRFFCDDMEASCDESAIRQLNRAQIAAYGETLLRLGTRRASFAGGPLAFGEHCTKGRIMNVLNYKKPAFWVILVAILAALTTTVVLLANPLEQPKKAVAPVLEAEDLWEFRVDTSAKEEKPLFDKSTRSQANDEAEESTLRGTVGSLCSIQLDINLFGEEASERDRAIEAFLKQLADGQTYIRAYLRLNAVGCYDEETAACMIKYTLQKDVEYEYYADYDSAEIKVGEEYWHCAQYDIYRLLHPKTLHWQHFGYAQYLGSVLNPYDIALAELNAGELINAGPYVQAYLDHGGHEANLTSEDYRLLVDAEAWYSLQNGMYWGTDYASKPICYRCIFSGTAEPGDDMNVMMASSFCAYLADKYGFDKLTSYCSGQIEFKQAFGVTFESAYDLWQQAINREFS